MKPIIHNKDIKAIAKKAETQSISQDELLLLKLENAVETKIQQTCRQMFLQQFRDKGLFVQIDNGNTFAKGVSQAQRMALFRRKEAEGSLAGFSDSMMLLNGKVVFVEFKRIGTPSQINIRPEQQKYCDWLNANGFKAYITNNPIYFRDIILKEFK